MDFEWDPNKDRANIEKHGIEFALAQFAFSDPKRLITEDNVHSSQRERRYFCFGKVNEKVMTVRFTYRNGKIRIIGAGFWREGRDKYEKQSKVL